MPRNPLDDDKGFQETEEELERLESELDALYRQASKETAQKANEYLDALISADEEMQKLVKKGEISEEEYKRWLQNHILTSEYYHQMADVIAADLLAVNQIAASVINGHMPEVYAINMNFMTYVIETTTKVNTLFTLYDRQTVERIVRDHPDLLPIASIDIAKDVRWSKSKIESAVIQGIMQGESIPDIAARLRMVSDMDLKASVRNARTMVTSAQNGGRLDSMRRVERMGAKIQKTWIATLDSRTRHAHRQLDGQKRPLDEPFDSEYGKIMMPGDPEARPENVYNCRCKIVTEDPEFPLDASNLEFRHSERLEGMSYEEWKKQHAKGESKKKPVNPDNPSYGYAPPKE